MKRKIKGLISFQTKLLSLVQLNAPFSQHSSADVVNKIKSCMQSSGLWGDALLLPSSVWQQDQIWIICWVCPDPRRGNRESTMHRAGFIKALFVCQGLVYDLHRNNAVPVFYTLPTKQRLRELNYCKGLFPTRFTHLESGAHTRCMSVSFFFILFFFTENCTVLSFSDFPVQTLSL